MAMGWSGLIKPSAANGLTVRRQLTLAFMVHRPQIMDVAWKCKGKRPMRNTLLIIAGAALIAAAALGLWSAYEAGRASSALISWIGLIAGFFALFFGLGGRANEKAITKREERSVAAQPDVELQALVQSMAAVTIADEKIRAEELRAIADVYEETLGLRLPVHDAQRILEDFTRDFDITASLRAVSMRISPEMKHNILRCCHRVMISDKEIVAAEVEKLREIGSALGMPRNEIEELTGTAV